MSAPAFCSRILRSCPLYHDWENGRRAYNYVITENMKRLLRRNYDMAVAPHIRSGLIDEQAPSPGFRPLPGFQRLWMSTSILAVDEHYSRRVHGFQSVEDYYRSCSCLALLPRLAVPMVHLPALTVHCLRCS